MNPNRPSAEPTPAWQRTVAAELSAPEAPRLQPPLREVFKGLDVRELEGETVFDQLFGKTPGPAR